MESSIEQMISNAKSSQLSEKQKREQELEDRRDAALKRIGKAALAFLDFERDSGHSDRILKQRMNDAMRVRISQAEAMATLAERGDFISELMWRDISDRGHTLWKGYVLRRRVGRVKIDQQGFWVDIGVRMIAEGGYVAEAFADAPRLAGRVITGMSPQSALEAAQGAYRAAIEVLELPFRSYPEQLDIFKDVDSEADI